MFIQVACKLEIYGNIQSQVIFKFPTKYHDFHI